jgi:5-methyltetrahydrofolate--homocysteine methyltransferase
MEVGAHALDVCMAMTERTDEREMLRLLVKKLALNVEAPLVLDSTEADVLQASLEQFPGRAIINSVNMENGRTRIDAVLPLALPHGAAVVAMTIDDEGWPRPPSASWRRRARSTTSLSPSTALRRKP